MPEKRGAGAELEVLFRSKIPSLFWRTYGGPSGGHSADIRHTFGGYTAGICQACGGSNRKAGLWDLETGMELGTMGTQFRSGCFKLENKDNTTYRCGKICSCTVTQKEDVVGKDNVIELLPSPIMHGLPSDAGSGFCVGWGSQDYTAREAR